MGRRKWVYFIAEVICVFAVTYAVGTWARRYAYMERGYNAIGGEYLFIPLVAWGVYKVANMFFEDSY